jgi:DNA-binding MarR family transcriptional regulator
MNEIASEVNLKLTQSQAQRLMDLIEEIIHCCQERVLFQSKKFLLTPAEMRLLILFKHERYLTVKDIARRLDVAKSRVTKIIDGLIEKKLIQRIHDPEDARIKLISLSPAGQKKFNVVEFFIKDIHHNLVVNLKSEERQSVLASLELLRSSMESVKEKML